MTQANAANRKDIRRAEKAAKLAESNSVAVVVNLCSTSAGRQWLWDRLADAHIFSTTLADTPERTAFNEGQRSAGLSLLAQVMAACPDQFIQAMREANDRAHTDDARRADTGDTADDDGDESFGPGNPDYDAGYTVR